MKAKKPKAKPVSKPKTAAALRRAHEATLKQLAGVQGTLMRSEAALAEALERLRDLERKVQRIAADPVVAVPQELKRRFEEHEARYKHDREGVAFELAGRAPIADLHELASRVKDLEEWKAGAQDAQDGHEDRLDALEEAATSDKPKLTVVPNPAAN